MTWNKVADGLPPSGKYVLAFYSNGLGNGRTVKAKWLAPLTHEASPDTDTDTDYDDASDTYYAVSGWYEIVDNWDDWSCVVIYQGDVTHWMELPPPPEVMG